jgi:hypothetical protein
VQGKKMICIRARLQACRTLRKRTSALAAPAPQEQIPAAEADSCRIAFDGIAEAKP